jgi:hypothetical protein
MTTEEEAKQKWCPKSIVTLGSRNEREQACGNRFEDAKDSNAYMQTRCLGGDCMMWRWHSPKRGYCGLAGKE